MTGSTVEPADPASVIFCYGCGQQIPELVAACPHCGAPQKTSAVSKPPAIGSSTADVGRLPTTPIIPSAETVSIPPGVKGWSWGAFLLNWIWAIGNRTWIGLLVFVPYLGIVMIVFLGIKGREWAWKNKSWESVEQFNAVQRKWSIWGFIFTGTVIVLGFLGGIGYGAYQDYRTRHAEQADSVVTVAPDPVSKSGDVETPKSEAPRAGSNALPFVGNREFNFSGGSGTGESIKINSAGVVQIEACGDPAMGGTCAQEYLGPYASPMRGSDGAGWLIQNDQIYRLQNGQPVMGCGDDGQQQCVTELVAD